MAESEMEFRRRTGSTMTADGFRIPVEEHLVVPFTADEVRLLRIVIEKQREEERYNFPEDVVGVITPKGESHVGSIQEDGEGSSHAGL